MTALQSLPEPEVIERFACFGGSCQVAVEGRGPAGAAAEAAQRARRRLEHWHHQFSRFEPESELALLNADPRETVPVSPVMARFIDAAMSVAEITGGLVDPTLVGDLERAGYRESFSTEPAQVVEFLELAPVRAAAAPNPEARWRTIHLDRSKNVVTRPPGLRLDSGGIAKGLFGDILASVLGGHRSFAVDAAGDVRLGGTPGSPRPVQVASPFDDSILHSFEAGHGAVATSGISKRSWLDGDGRPGHHLLDPATGRPAFTGLLQVTAFASSGVEAEALSKAALLSGPEGARPWLVRGGLIVRDDGSFEVFPLPAAEPR